jgi:precorrin-2/cobalt-factor-2 C20-methyltransferase
MNESGTLYGIGVGPGDPDLLTLAAIKRLALVDVVLAASSSKNEYSLAQSIAEPHLPETVHIKRLKFPMTRDRDALSRAWEENTAIAIDLLDQGKNLAFLTLGDPMIYSTFGYLLRGIQRVRPSVPVEIIPGITSFQAAAARTQTVLTESGENLVIFSGVGDEKQLARTLDMADTGVILKAYKNFDALKQIITRHDRNKQTVFVSRLGHHDERITRDLDEITEHPHYLSLLLVKR